MEKGRQYVKNYELELRIKEACQRANANPEDKSLLDEIGKLMTEQIQHQVKTIRYCESW